MNFPFQKIVGAGNDFIFVNADLFENETQRPLVAKTLCDRKWGIGADGFVFMKTLNRDNNHFRWDFYNNDGSFAEMCGNAARCAVLYCFENFGCTNCTIESHIGPLQGTYDSEKIHISWEIDQPTLKEKVISLENGKQVKGQFINTGVPHFVVQQNSLALNGRDCLLIQEHSEFQPSQTNVTLLKEEGGQFFTKSFERGVRDFTLACGTGVIASAFVLKNLSPKDIYPLSAPGGEMAVKFNGSHVTLIGPATITFTGDAQWKRG